MYSAWWNQQIRLVVVALLLVGCGGTAAPSVSPVPAVVVATRTPTADPLLPPPRPLATPNPNRTALPLATAAPLATFTPAERLRYADGLFSLDLPVGWEITDLSDERASLTSFEDPARQVAVLIMVLDGSAVPPDTGLERQLADFTNSLFGGRTFVFDVPETLNADTRQARFRFDDITADELRRPTEGIARVQRVGNFYTFLVAVTHRDHFAALLPSLTQIFDSYTLDPAVAERRVPDPVTPTPPPAPVSLATLPVFTLATPLPPNDLRVQRISRQLAAQFPDAESQIYALPPATEFNAVRQFYVNQLQGWEDATLLFPELLEAQIDNVAIWQRGEQILLISTFPDELNEQLVLVTVLMDR